MIINSVLITLFDVVISYILAAASGVAINWGFTAVLAGVTFFCALITGALSSRGHWVSGMLLGYGGLGAAVILLRSQMVSGILYIGESVISRVNEVYGMEFSMGIRNSGDEIRALLVFWMVLWLAVPCMTCVGSSRLKFWIMMELSVISLGAMLALNRAPGFRTGGALCAVLLLTRLVTSLEEDRVSRDLRAFRAGIKVDRDKIYRYRQKPLLPAEGSSGSDRMFAGFRRKIILPVAVFTAAAVLTLVLGPGLLSQNTRAMKFQTDLEQYVRSLGSASITDGGLSNRKPKKTHKVMLTLDIQEDDGPEGTESGFMTEYADKEYFLRGFTGDYYDGNRWNRYTDKGAFDKLYPGMSKYDRASFVNDLAFESIESGSNLRTFISDSLGGDMYIDSGPRTLHKTTVTYKNVQDRYEYAPAYVSHRGLSGELDSDCDSTYLRKSGVDSVTYDGYYSSGLSSWGETDDEEYEAYARANYMDVPENLRSRLTKMLNPDKFPTLGSKVGAVTSYLQKNFKYSTSLDNLNFGEDFVDHFLEYRKGYCTHFATLGTLMFRNMGIPARYVTGYAVSYNFISKTSGGSVHYVSDVKDDDAHAWCEIYVADIGWIPVDVTPGSKFDYNFSAYSNTLGAVSGIDGADQIRREIEGREKEDETESESGAGASGDGYSNSYATTAAAATTQAQTASGEAGGAGSGQKDGRNRSMYKKILRIALPLIAIALLLIAVFLWRKSFPARMRRPVRQEGPRAFTVINRRVMAVFRHFRLKKQDTESECEFLERVCGDAAAAQAYYQVLEKEKYSSGSQLTEGDIAVCKEFLDQLLKAVVQ